MGDSNRIERLARAASEIRRICDNSRGYSQYHEFGTHGYKDGVRHWLPSSSAIAHAVVQPGNIQDLAQIVGTLGRNRVPFAVKGGGHFTSPNISSTTGIQIHMGRFDKVTYNPISTHVDVEAGCLWDRVYLALERYQRNVVGGSASEGVGVAGWLLGGGYSLKTNRYGLGIDHIVAFTLVLPNGNQTTVTDRETDPDRRELFIALKGGGNNFGIITTFRLKTHSQDYPLAKIELTFPETEFDAVKIALGNYATSFFDKKSAVVAAFRREIKKGKIEDSVEILCFYDGYIPFNSPFQEFQSIKNTPLAESPFSDFSSNARDSRSNSTSPQYFNSFYEMDMGSSGHLRRGADANEVDPGRSDDYESSWGTSFNNYDRSGFYDDDFSRTPSSGPGWLHDMTGLPKPNSSTAGLGETSYAGRFACIMIKKYTKTLIDIVASAPKDFASETEMIQYGGKLVLFDVWPFLPTIFQNSKPSAWPHPASRPCFPLIALFQWEDSPENTAFWLRRIFEAFNLIKLVAVSEGCADSSLPVYLNTSLDTTNVEEIYKENFDWLRRIRRKWDVDNVMGLASGFRIPLSDEEGRRSPSPSSPISRPDSPSSFAPPFCENI